MRKKRGISPLIASVLLIAFTIMLFVLISTWVRRTAVEPAMQSGEEKLGSALACMNTKVDVASMCYGSSIIKFDVDNTGDTNLMGLGLRVVSSKTSQILMYDASSAKVPYDRITGQVSFDGSTYGAVNTWNVEVYPKISSGICSDGMEISSVITCT